MARNYYTDIRESANDVAVVARDWTEQLQTWAYVAGYQPVAVPNSQNPQRQGVSNFWNGLSQAEQVGVLLGVVGIVIALVKD